MNADRFSEYLTAPPIPSDLLTLPPAGVLGDVERGRELSSGRFVFCGETVALKSQDPFYRVWSSHSPSLAWTQWLHSFRWLADLRALEEPDIVRHAVDAWTAHSPNAPAIASAPETVGERVFAWLEAAETLFAETTPDYSTRVGALARDVLRLDAEIKNAEPGRPRLSALIALTAGAAALPGFEEVVDLSMPVLVEEASRQITPDGGHTDRRPQTVIDILIELHLLNDVLNGIDQDPPDDLRRVITRLTAMADFVRGPDGRLFAFHGGGRGVLARCEAAMRRAEPGGRSAFSVAPHFGYQRVSANGDTLMFDVGAPPATRNAHVSPLALEFSTPSGPLIGGCGWSPGQHQRMRDAVRATAAHSALVVEDTNAMPPTELGSPQRPLSVRRNEEEAGVWLEAGHEGYLRAFGVAHRRRLYLAANGGDLRGEDTVFKPVAAAAEETKSISFTIRFHAHPDVRVQLGRDGRSAVLTLKDGDSWRFRTDAGAVTIENSIYLSEGLTPRETRQIVVSGVAPTDGAIDRPPNRVRWALRRLGRAPSA